MAQDSIDNRLERLWEESMEYHTEEETVQLIESFSEWLDDRKATDSIETPFHRNRCNTKWSIQTRTQGQQKQGYAQRSDSLIEASKAYVGEPFSLSFQCSQTINKKIQWGLVAEKDAGEKGLDYLSGHLMLHDLHAFKLIVLGDFRVKFGQGLILSSGFFGGKSTASNASLTKGQSIRRHFSFSEAGFMRGLGAECLLGSHWGIVAFASQRKIDTQRQGDVFSSVKQDGLYRTQKEIDKKRNTLLQQLGGQLSYRGYYGQMGMNVLVFRYDATCQPEWKPYNIFYFRQSSGINLSLDYRALWQGILWSGESAIDANGHSAHLLNADFQPHSLVHCFLSARYYGKRYQAPFAAAFSEGSGVRNEIGLYTSVDYRLWKYLEVKGYVDYFYFPWLKYGVHAPSSGYEWAMEASYSPLKDWEVRLKYKEKSTCQNLSSVSSRGIYPCREGLKRTLRGQLQCNYGDWRLKSRAETTLFQAEQLTYGSALAQEIRLAPQHKRWWLSGQYTLFDVASFENSIYFYEQDLPNSFSIPSLYGKGIRYSLLYGQRLGERWKWHFKVRHTVYSDRESIGSGLEQIDGKRATLFGCQLSGVF